ncbi:hypothetical protein [Dehalobacterium formicoaceticum]|uniref:TDE2712 family protein n=1 Tax=Dehalobacterium formicoaceticum TaxID=51515 RepID=UPI0031F6A1CF
MNTKITKNLEVIEAMLYYWNALKDKEKVTEKFIYDIGEMPGLTNAYDEEFDSESVRRTLSAIKNRERFTSRTKKEARFWNNNLWMMEDLGYTDAMIQPLKKLNLDDLGENIQELAESKNFDQLEVIFAPLHFDDYYIKENKLIINFFKVKPVEDKAYIGEQELTEFIKEKLIELLKK